MSGSMNSMMQNPLLYAGLGMLGQSGVSRTPQSPFAGAMQGLGMYGRQNYMNQQTLAMQQQMEQRKRQEEKHRQQQAMMPQLMEAFMNPQTSEARGQALSGMVGLNPSLAGQLLPGMLKPAARGRPMEIADPSSPTGTRFVYPEEAIGQPGKPARGMVLTTNPDGSVSFQTNVPAGQGGMLDKTFARKRQEEAFDYGVLREQLSDIRSAYKPEYQQYTGQIQNWLTAGKEKLGVPLSETETGVLRDYTDFRAKSGQVFAEQLNRMSGAAVTEHEAKRQRVYLPNEKDSPSQFEAKLKSFESFADMAQARSAYAAKKGIDYTEIPLTEMPKVIADRYSNVLDEMLKSMPPDIASVQAESQVKAEFGL